MTAKGQELAQVIEQYGNMVFRLALTRVRNEADAEDICQEVFLRWFQHAESLLSEEHCRAWLIRVTLNCTSSLLSSSWFKRTVPLPETLRAAPRRESEVYSAVMRLSKTDRTMIHLYYYEGFKTAEIAEIMGITESTVRSGLCRARRRLKKMLEGADS